MVKNRIHGLLDKHCLRMPETTPFSDGNIAWLRERSHGFMDDAILRSDLAFLETVGEQVERIEEKIAAIAAEEQRVRLHMTMTSVGYFTAMLILTEVGDIGRFRGEKKFASWMRLAPTVRQSGEKTRIGGVSGPGNKRLRWAMVEYSGHGSV
jgi:transposase